MANSKTITMETLSERMARLQAERDEALKLDENKTIIAIGTGAFIRTAPDHTSRSIGKLNKGVKAEIDDVVVGEFLNGTDLWYKITHGLKVGFVHSSLVRPER